MIDENNNNNMKTIIVWLFNGLWLIFSGLQMMSAGLLDDVGEIRWFFFYSECSE